MKCPYCRSNNTRQSTKEANMFWQLGAGVAKIGKSEKVTYSETECLSCKRSFQPNQTKSDVQNSLAKIEERLIGTPAIVETAKGIQIQGSIVGEDYTIVVRAKGGIIRVTHQIELEIREAAINMDAPLVVYVSGLPFGVMWAANVSEQGYTRGIVQPITSEKLT